jgi:hypothetical protein
MDVTTVNNAVSDAVANLPAGTSSFINANIGTAAGQQAIYNAGISLGLSQAQIASVVSQATGQTVTPQQVAQVAATIAPVAPPAAPVAPAYTPPPAPPPAQTTLGSMASPQFVGTTAPGAVGTNYGQASNAQIASVQQGSPDFATALQNGTAKMTFDGDGVPYLYDAKSGQPIAGNYQLQVGNNGALGINVPAVNGSMIQIATNLNQDGSLPPVTASNVLNVGLNAGAGGFAGGISDLKPFLVRAALMYAGSQLGALGGGESALDAGMGVYPTGGVDPTLLGNASALDAGLGVYPTTGQVGTQSALDAGAGVYPTTAVNPVINPSNTTTLGNVGTPVTTPVVAPATTATVPTTPTGTATTTVAPVNSALDAGAGVYPTTGNVGVVPPVTTLLTPTNVLAGTAAINALSGLNTNTAIKNAAGTQAVAGQAAQTALTDFGKTYGQLQAPYQQTGVQATNQLGAMGSGTYNIMNPDGTVNTTGTGTGYLSHQFDAKDLQAGLAPNYDFMLAQGAGANRNLANASGGQISGNTLQGLNTFNQNYANNAYQNAFTNYQNQRQNIYQNLASQAGLGGTSLGQLGSVGANLANTYGNVTTGLAASQAGATTAQAVNTQNTLSNIGQTAFLASMIKQPTAPA